jgi:hypothetical protein
VSDVNAAATTLGPRQRKQIAWITAVAIAVFVGMRFMPTGTNLNHMDFRVSGKNAIEFCDPANPQFIPVVAVRSPVTMEVKWETVLEGGRKLRPGADLKAGYQGRGRVTLRTASGKLIEPQDLLVAHTRKLHLLIVDPSLEDYQHVHRSRAGSPGSGRFPLRRAKGGRIGCLRILPRLRRGADFTRVRIWKWKTIACAPYVAARAPPQRFR